MKKGLLNSAIIVFAALTAFACVRQPATITNVCAHYPRGTEEFDRDFLASHFAYPDGKIKALILSFDDGTIQDKRLVQLFNRYGLRGTFNLNSGKVVRVVLSNRTYGYVSTNDVRTVYEGHEICVHTVNHPWLTQLPADRIAFEIGKDKENLEKWWGKPIRGMAYPFNAYNELVVSLLPGLGIHYVRAAWSTGSLKLPVHPLTWKFTCHISQMNAFAERYFRMTNRTLTLLAVGGHSWEIDEADTNKNWAAMEKFCATMSARSDEVWNPTMGGFYDYMIAMSAVKFYNHETSARNFSTMPVWVLATNGEVIKLEPGEQASLTGAAR